MTLFWDTFSGDVETEAFRSSVEVSDSEVSISADFLPFNKINHSVYKHILTPSSTVTHRNETFFNTTTTTTTTTNMLLSVVSSSVPEIVYSDVKINMMDKTSYGLFGELERYSELWIAKYLNLYYLWVIFLFGFSGNFAIFITVIKMRPHRSYTVCIAALAVVNNCAIISKLLFHQLTLYDVPIGLWGCRVLYYFGSFFTAYSSWIIVAMTLERFVAIYFPLKVITVCSRTKIIFFLGIMATFLLFADLHFFWTATDTFHPVFKEHCGFLRQYQHFIQYYWYWMDGCMYAIVPCILLLIFNVVNIFGIRQSYKTQKEFLKNRSELIVERFRDQGKITIMVVAVSVLFLLLVIPNCCHYVIKPTWVYTPVSHGHAVFLLTREIIFVLSDANHGIQFFIYFVMAKPFRREFLNFFCCRENRKRGSSSACYMVSGFRPFKNVKLLSVSTISVIDISKSADY